MSSVAQAVQAGPESAQVLQFPSKAKKAVKAKKVAGLVANVDGVTAYETKRGVRFLAQVRVNGRNESKSFDDRKAASDWKTAREVDVFAKKLGSVPAKLTMGELFALYVTESERHGSPLPTHQVYMFDRLKAHPLLKDVKVVDMNFSVVRDYCVERKTIGGVCASTLQAEYARISVAIERGAEWLGWGENFIHPLTGARKKLMRAKLIADSNKRTRRPAREERAKLAAYFNANEHCIPMTDIMEFAAINTFRRGEIFALLWSKLDVAASTIECWRKDSQSEGGKRKVLVPVLPAALAIIMRQPRIEGEDRIFPYSGDTVSGKFAAARKALGIEDLRFHDLRHEAITTASRFLNQSELKALSGHKTDRHVARYINHTKEDISAIAQKGAAIAALS
jgi:Phage integrase family